MSWGILGDEKVCTGIRIADKRGDLITVIADCDDDLGSHDFFNGAIADADLIAAAPDMLKFIEVVRETLIWFSPKGKHPSLDLLQEMSIEVIAKAEGKDAG